MRLRKEEEEEEGEWSLSLLQFGDGINCNALVALLPVAYEL